MTTFRTLVAAALVAASSSMALAEGLRIDTPAQTSRILTEGRNAAVTVHGNEVGVSLYERGPAGVVMQNRGVNTVSIDSTGDRAANN